MKVLGVIPARYASTRFPGKPLADVDGKSMIMRVYERTLMSKYLSGVIVATDDTRIFEHVKINGGKVILTSRKHQSGTERCNEVVNLLSEKFDVIVNIQGDEPFINPKQIDSLTVAFIENEISIATLIKKINNEAELFNENVVKVVIDKNHNALYFSRSTIPFIRGCDTNNWLNKTTFYKHLGIYAYKIDILKKIVELTQSDYEKCESLEQLRWLEKGFKIHTIITDYESVSIDTPEDIEKAKLFLKSKKNI